MRELKSLIDKYKNYADAGKKLGDVNPQQLKRLVDKGALYNKDGDIYIPSQTKLKFK